MNIFQSLSYLDPVNVSDNATLVQCPINIPLLSWHPSSFNAVAKVSSLLAITVNFLTMPFTVFLNALIIVVVWKNESLQIERVIVLAYLALADLMVGLFSQPLFIAREILQLKTNTRNCNMETAQFFFGYLFVSVAFSQLVLVTYERYVAIIHPYQYPTRITVKRLTCAAIVLGAVITLITISYFVLVEVALPVFYLDIFALVVNAVAMILMVYWYVRIFLAIRRQSRLVVQQQQNAGMNNQHTLQNHKGAITAALLLGCFSVSYNPMIAAFFLKHVLHGVVDFSGSGYLPLLPWALTFVQLGSFVNPLIYGKRVRELRTKCLKFLRFNINNVPE